MMPHKYLLPFQRSSGHLSSSDSGCLIFPNVQVFFRQQ
jgi:hypothetical protein